MIQKIEWLGERLLSRILPAESASAGCTHRGSVVAMRSLQMAGRCYRLAYRHEVRENDCRWYTDEPCGTRVSNWCC